MWLFAALLAWPALVSGLAAALLPDLGGSGLDFDPEPVPAGARVLGWVLAISWAVFPLLTALWARRVWLGYLLLGLALCAVTGGVGLVQQGIL